MRKIKIVSDSSSDLLTLEKADFASAPMKIITAERGFVDDAELDVGEMTDFLFDFDGRSQTSCPGPSDWLDAFGSADDIICFTITSALSGSFNSAQAAKRIYEEENEGRRVFVVDTLSAGPEITMAVRYAEKCIDDGMSYEEICAGIKEYMGKTGLVFMLSSLKNFANNGRVSPLVAKIAGFAGIRIVGRASDDGKLDVAHKCRGEAKSLATLMSTMCDMGFSGGSVSIGHCQNGDAAEKMKKTIEERFGGTDVEIHELRGLCGFYAEKGGLLVGFERDRT